MMIFISIFFGINSYLNLRDTCHILGVFGLLFGSVGFKFLFLTI